MKKKYIIINLIAVALTTLAAVLLFTPVLSSLFPGRDYSARFKIPQYRSANDADGDGVDDQTDLLEGARGYVATRPKYKSKYYVSGYPDDGYGVCTDVVAEAMRAAGYDLMALVAADIAAHPDDYPTETPDPNIDFRRVKNLAVYFEHTAESLTTDPADIREWQGGDIVIFRNHIGVVSDKRNIRGVTYVIHHSGPAQLYFEQDILEARNDIIGHYRIK